MRKNAVAAVYSAGLVQGVALVAFPAASAIFTSPDSFNFTSTAYGGLFIPQALLSIAASLYSSKLAHERGIKRVFMFGLFANLLAMVLLAASRLLMGHPIAYEVLLLATASLGVGFGLTVPSLNTLAAHFFPKKVDTAVLALNALLGLGTALAPLFIALFTRIGLWWGLPTLLALAIIILIFFSSPLRLQNGKVTKPKRKGKIPPVFWIFAGFALLYGMIETVNGNWGAVYMKKELHDSAAMASLSLTFFWAAVTAGRIFFALIEKVLSGNWVLRVLPFFAAGSFVIAAYMPFEIPLAQASVFALAGFGCSALLPLIISFGEKTLPAMGASLAGGLIAFYLLGYGVAAFGVGPLHDEVGLPLSTIFGVSALLALALGVMAFIVIKCQEKKL